jgi:hypothetical protein
MVTIIHSREQSRFGGAPHWHLATVFVNGFPNLERLKHLAAGDEQRVPPEILPGANSDDFVSYYAIHEAAGVPPSVSERCYWISSLMPYESFWVELIGVWPKERFVMEYCPALFICNVNLRDLEVYSPGVAEHPGSLRNPHPVVDVILHHAVRYSVWQNGPPS